MEETFEEWFKDRFGNATLTDIKFTAERAWCKQQQKITQRDKNIAHLKSEQTEIAKELNRQVSYWKKHADERRDRIAELEKILEQKRNK